MPQTSYISETLVIRALNTPGGSGGVARFADRVARRMVAQAISIAPMGEVGDAGSRDGLVGVYKASFHWKKVRGGNAHHVRRDIYNSAGHARFVEFGRGRSWGYEKFTSHGQWRRTIRGTAGWPGQHVLGRAQALTTLEFNL